MNTTDNNLDPQLPTPQPTAITRRSFIKRTAATALICVLAVNAFADEPTSWSNVSSPIYGMELISTPESITVLDNMTILPIEQKVLTGTWTPTLYTEMVNPTFSGTMTAPAYSYVITVDTLCEPSNFHKTLLEDGLKHFVYGSQVVTYTINFKLYSGTMLVASGISIETASFGVDLIKTKSPNLKISSNPEKKLKFEVKVPSFDFSVLIAK